MGEVVGGGSPAVAKKRGRGLTGRREGMGCARGFFMGEIMSMILFFLIRICQVFGHRFFLFSPHG